MSLIPQKILAYLKAFPHQFTHCLFLCSNRRYCLGDFVRRHAYRNRRFCELLNKDGGCGVVEIRHLVIQNFPK